MNWNGCPDKTGMNVRNKPERLSGMTGISTSQEKCEKYCTSSGHYPPPRFSNEMQNKILKTQ